MVMSIAAKHAKGKAAQDKIFGANAAAVAAAAKYGKDAAGPVGEYVKSMKDALR